MDGDARAVLCCARAIQRMVMDFWITMFLRRCTGRLVLSGYSVVTVETKATINRYELWKIPHPHRVNTTTATA